MEHTKAYQEFKKNGNATYRFGCDKGCVVVPDDEELG